MTCLRFLMRAVEHKAKQFSLEMPPRKVLPAGALDEAVRDENTSKASASSLQNLIEAQLAATVRAPHEPAGTFGAAPEQRVGESAGIGTSSAAVGEHGRPVNRQELMDGWRKTDSLRQQMLSEIDVLGPLRPRDLRTGCERAR